MFKDLTRFDSQIQEILSKNILINKLLKNDFEIAIPVRDCGIDLLVYNKAHTSIFKKVQLKSSLSGGFSFKKSYLKIPDMVFVFIMDLKSDTHRIYGMTNLEMQTALKEAGIKYNTKGYVYRKAIPKRLKEKFDGFEITNETKFTNFFNKKVL